MIFFAVPICYYVFWKTMFRESNLNLNFDDYFPMTKHLAMCVR